MFDPSGLQGQIAALQQAPGFDPSGLASQISALQNQLVNLQTSFNPAVTGGFNPAGGPINVGTTGGPVKIASRSK